ncbi:MAG: hypothetical protein WCX69_00120 [Candidatus Paceibacterota bacterium]
MKIYIKIIIAALAIGIVTISYFNIFGKPVSVATDKNDYKVGDSLEVVIKNNLDKPICFSSCYPYLMELKKSGNWVAYSYPECLHGQALSCVQPAAEKKFQLTLDEAEIGTTRMKIQVCVDCQGQNFLPDFTFYSNNFEIQK